MIKRFETILSCSELLCQLEQFVIPPFQELLNVLELFFILLSIVSIGSFVGGIAYDSRFLIFFAGALLVVSGILIYADGVDRVSQVDSSGNIIYESVSGATDSTAYYLSLMFLGFGAIGMGMSLFKGD